ncbi:MAG TPA: chemotaxis protein CheB [Kofleriaceae bacterium]
MTVVVGASTAAAVETLVRTLPERGELVLVIACPTEPALADRLAAVSPWPVVVARGRVALEPDRIYVLPADGEGAFQRGELLVTNSNDPRPPIDRLLRSLAEEHGAQGAGVLLDGQGDDGLIGIKQLKEAGGLTILQIPGGSEAAGVVDMVLDLAAIAPRLAAIVRDQRGPATDARSRTGSTAWS